MAVELEKYLEEALTQMSPNDPSRNFLERLAKETKDQLYALRLANKLREVFGLLPDDSKISDIIPEYFHINVIDSRVRRGRYRNMTREEVNAQYPQWQQVYSNAEPREKPLLTNLTFLITHRVLPAGINTLEDLRNIGDETLVAFSKDAESKSNILLRTGFTPVQESLSEG